MNKHRFWLTVFSVITVILLNLVIWAIVVRVSNNTSASRKLCDTFVGIIRKQDASLGQFAYYKQHPDELVKAHKQTRQTIKTLNCGGL